jgi:adenine deaminase
MRTLAITLLLAALPALAQTPACTTTPAKPAGSVTATGCVAPGVEAKCLVLRDAKTGKTYSLFFNGSAPAAGTAITFTGEPFHGVSACMQSNPVTVKTCTIVQMSCPTPAKPVLAQ